MKSIHTDYADQTKAQACSPVSPGRRCPDSLPRSVSRCCRRLTRQFPSSSPRTYWRTCIDYELVSLIPGRDYLAVSSGNFCSNVGRRRRYPHSLLRCFMVHPFSDFGGIYRRRGNVDANMSVNRNTCIIGFPPSFRLGEMLIPLITTDFTKLFVLHTSCRKKSEKEHSKIRQLGIENWRLRRHEISRNLRDNGNS